ncbi:MAG TPA: glutathione S-transferase [Oceanospirillales bacterium]|nr:glutathione S-transferase [Oceanospirillaceae bacterium]HBS42664.1 glutathione S-transferase [Oceanospirillales bacterium]|tara:strand:- start:2502 stop:3113 length:612 start_codon:yes stop_codon:yes gene_type:complete
MKLYNNAHAPNPRRVRILLAEKGVTEYVTEELDLGKGENLSEHFRGINPLLKVPVLELADGLCLSETPAICRYLDETFPEPPLYGQSRKERAIIDMWDHRVEYGLLWPAMFGFQHISGYFKDRMNPLAEWGQESVQNFMNMLPVLEQQLSQNEWVAGSHFSVADITAVCAIDFARIVKVRVGDEFPSIKRWHEAVKQRPSYGA